MEEEASFDFPDLTSIEDDKSRRDLCQGCSRPSRVCWCQFVPDPALETSRCRFAILQHPNESKRQIRTALMAVRGIAGGMCKVYVGRKFPGKYEELGEILGSEDTWLLYPGGKGMGEVRKGHSTKRQNFVILDGTWNEAKKILSWNPDLQRLPRASLDHSEAEKSFYVVRTQPEDGCLSTVEAVARTLSLMEDMPEAFEAIVRPLHAMCNWQINHGAVRHDSKEFKSQNSAFVKKNDFKKKRKT